MPHDDDSRFEAAHPLELRVPPVALGIVCGALMSGLAAVFPSATLLVVPWWLCAAVAAAGVAVALAGVAAFREARTTVNPMAPESSSAVVRSGVYGWTRNPMYVGFLAVLVALALALGNFASAMLLPLFVAWMNRFQIVPEERALRATFGEEYERYCLAVRRWF